MRGRQRQSEHGRTGSTARLRVAGTRAAPVAGRTTSRTSPAAPTARCGWPTRRQRRRPEHRRADRAARPRAARSCTGSDYPDGPHDAEALLLSGDGRPVIVTKELGGRSAIYTVDAALPPEPATATDPAAARRRRRRPGLGHPERGPMGGRARGRRGWSPGARCPPTAGSSRCGPTPTPGSTPPGAPRRPRTSSPRCAGTPVRVPLPDEPQGEAIAFAADGTLLSAGESPGGAARGGAAGGAGRGGAGRRGGARPGRRPRRPGAGDPAGPDSRVRRSSRSSPCVAGVGGAARPSSVAVLPSRRRAGRSEPAQHRDDPAQHGGLVAGDGLVGRVRRHQPDVPVLRLKVLTVASPSIIAATISPFSATAAGARRPSRRR